MDPVLKQRLDAFVGTGSNPGQLVQELIALCDATPDAAWDVLSLTDQYYRRGKVSRDVLRSLRARIIPHVLGAAPAFPGATGATGTIGATASAISDPPAAQDPQRPEPSHRPRAAAGEAGPLPVGVPDPTRVALEREVETLRRAADRNRALLRRYRNRITILLRYGRLARSRLAVAQRNLQIARDRAGLQSGAHLGIFAALLLLVTAGLALQGPSRSVDRAKAVTRVATPPTRLVAPIAPAAPAATPDGGTSAGAGPSNRVEPRPHSRIGIAADRYVVFPGQTRAEIQVRRDANLPFAVSFLWWTQGGGAKPGRDYVAIRPQNAVIPAGAQSVLLSVPILPDPVRRHTEFFYVVIGNPTDGASLGSVARASVFLMPHR